MLHKRFFCGLVSLLIVLSLSPILASAQKKDNSEKKKEEAQNAQGTPVLWREPTDIASRDLFLGPGGEQMKPDLSRVTFVRDEPGGYSVKFRVRDGAGRVWVAKLGNEAQPETAAVRLVWAVGYMTEVNYLAPCVHIEGAPKPRKDVERCNNGQDFANVRFEARPKDVKRLDIWSWKDNPFVGTKEMQGLIIMMAMMNNWDLKDENNKILLVHVNNTELAPVSNAKLPSPNDTLGDKSNSPSNDQAKSDDQSKADNTPNNSSDNNNSANNKAQDTANNAGNNNSDKDKSDNTRPAGAPAQNELQYIISDLGATFGRTGNAITHNRNKPETFIKTKFVKRVEGDKVLFDYHGKSGSLFDNITVEQAKWIGDLLSRLSDKQIADAFRAANYSPEEIQALTQALRARINELVNLPGPGQQSATTK